VTRKKSGILHRGELVNDTYDVQVFIGEGAFGEVYRVKHKYLGLQVLKVFKEDYVKSSDLDTLTKEARILSQLTHPNIVRVFETNTFEKNDILHYFITMEFVSGESLAQLLKRKISISAQTALSIQLALLKGLKEVHSQCPPIIHRDISPDNILLSYNEDVPRALISDFGLAQSVDQMSHLADAGGKYLYFAPECFWGVYMPASDVFSAGIILYRMLTGTHPWSYNFDGLTGDDREELATMIISSRKIRPSNPSEYNEECTRRMDEIVMRSLRSNLEDRYCNAKEFLDDLTIEWKNLRVPTIDSSLAEQLYY